MKHNPVLKKELKIGTRSVRLPIALMFYVLIMSAVVLFSLFRTMFFEGFWGRSFDFYHLTDLFYRMAYVQLFLLSLIIPVLAGAAIAGERERQTLDILMSTPVSPLSIVLGKLLSVMVQVMMFIIASIPVMAVSFLYGGLPWYYLLGFLVLMLAFSFFNGSVGLFCSTVFRKTIPSIITAMLIEAAFYAGLWLLKLNAWVCMAPALVLGVIFTVLAAQRLDRVYGLRSGKSR